MEEFYGESSRFRDLIRKNHLFFSTISQLAIPHDRYTVFASLNRLGDHKLLALATGTQACLRRYPDDIQDCHAESLLKRAFKRHLIEQQCSESPPGVANTCLDLILFISQFPCGLTRRYGGDERTQSDGQTIRRKPGRGLVQDGTVVYVPEPPCIDKLIKWTREGFQGQRLAKLFGIHARIRFIIIGGCESSCPDYNKHEFSKLRETLQPHDSQLQVVTLPSFRSEEFIRLPSKEPHPIATVWWSSNESNDNGVVEFLVDGRKKGLTFKSLKSGKFRQLNIVNSSINRDIDKLVEWKKSSDHGACD